MARICAKLVGGPPTRRRRQFHPGPARLRQSDYFPSPLFQATLVRYATNALPNKPLVRKYLTALPDEKLLAAELERTRKQLVTRR